MVPLGSITSCMIDGLRQRGRRRMFRRTRVDRPVRGISRNPRRVRYRSSGNRGATRGIETCRRQGNDARIFNELPVGPSAGGARRTVRQPVSRVVGSSPPTQSPIEVWFEIVDQPVHINDFHATLLHLFGLDHLQLTYRFQGRDFRFTDVGGRVIQSALS